MNSQTIGPIACVVAATVCAVQAVRSFNGFGGLGVAVLVLVAAPIVVGLLHLTARSGLSGRMVAVAGHGHDRATIARHEAGHAAAARALGGRVRSARITNHGGLVMATLPTSDSQAAVTFWLAGQVAAGTPHGSGADNQLIRRELRGLPSAERRQVLRASTADANRIVRSHAGRIDRDTVTLDTKGRL